MRPERRTPWTILRVSLTVEFIAKINLLFQSTTCNWLFNQIYIMWHVEKLLDNDREIGNYTTAVAKQRLRKQTYFHGMHCNRRTVFSTRSVPICYKEDKWWVSEWVRESVGWRVSELEYCWCSVFVSCCCKKLVAEAGDSSGTQRMGNIRRWKPLPSNGSEDIVTRCIKESNKSSHQSKSHL
jgi:hypothetical protein